MFMENYLNKAELRKKFNICAETLDKILDYLELPFEIKIATNYKRVPYYNQESVDKIEKFMKEEYNSNFFMSLTLHEKGWIDDYKNVENMKEFLWNNKIARYWNCGYLICEL